MNRLGEISLLDENFVNLCRYSIWQHFEPSLQKFIDIYWEFVVYENGQILTK